MKKAAKKKIPAAKSAASARSNGAALLADLESENRQLRDSLTYLQEFRDAESHALIELEALREHYANLYDFAPVGYADLDRQGCVRNINLVGATLFNQPREDLLDRPILPLAAKADRRKWLSHLSTMRKQDSAIVELQLARKDSPTLRFYTVRIKPESGRGLRAAVLRTAIIDVTAQRQAEDALRQAKEAAEVANRTKDRFLAVLSHELRTPLTPVLATADMLLGDVGLPACYHENLEMIRRNVEMEARLIDDLLDITRISRGKLEMEFRPVSLVDVIHRAIEVCHVDIARKELRLVKNLEAIESITVYADAGRLQQVFWNLLKNAIKFTPTGGRIEIRARKDSHGFVTIEVEDNGVGIGANVLPRIFEAFEQGSLETTRRFGGLGLGLAICHAVIEKHGGEITAASDGPNKGACLTIRLPTRRINGESTARQTPARNGHLARRTAPNHLRILLVEDHSDTAKVMGQLLIRSGFTVDAVSDVATALRKAADAGPFDLLISDLGLPDGTGFDLMRELRKRACRIPAVALSGYGQENDVRQSIEAGFSIHLTKPADPDRLLQTIYTLVGIAAAD